MTQVCIYGCIYVCVCFPVLIPLSISSVVWSWPSSFIGIRLHLGETNNKQAAFQSTAPFHTFTTPTACCYGTAEISRDQTVYLFPAPCTWLCPDTDTWLTEKAVSPPCCLWTPPLLKEPERVAQTQGGHFTNSAPYGMPCGSNELD